LDPLISKFKFLIIYKIPLAVQGANVLSPKNVAPRFNLLNPSTSLFGSIKSKIFFAFK
jgi:hypothetical protein